MHKVMTVGFDYYCDPISSPLKDGFLIFINTFRNPDFFSISGFFTVLIMFALPMWHGPVAAEVKFLIVCAAASALCLLTYDRLVRNTWLGGLLNGRRYPRGLPGRLA